MIVPGCRLWRVRFVVLTAMVVCTILSPARAEKSATEFLEPVVTHRQFTDLVRSLGLDREQRMIVELVFADYTDAIAQLAAEADREADAAGRQTILEAYAGRRLVDPSQLRRLRIEVLEIYRGYWPRIDRHHDDLVDGVRSLLTEEQRRALVGPLLQIRRSMLLHPRQAGRNSFEYAGDGVDLLLLLDEATREGGELHGIGGTLDDVRRRYEQDLDDLLTETAAAYRSNRMDARIARIRRDSDALREAQQRELDLWRQLYDLNERTMRQVGEIAAARRGEQSRRQWRQRFQEACFPWVYTEGAIDRQFAWISQQQLSHEQRARAAEVHEAFQRRRTELREAAIAMMLSARKELRSIVYAMMDPAELTGPITRSVYEQLLRNSGELATAEANATAGFESILSDSQRAAMRRAMRR